MLETEDGSPQQEHRYHHYSGNRIPWYVRAMWIGFWVLAITYAIRFLFPAVRVELFELP
jgi:hypothetical protein